MPWLRISLPHCRRLTKCCPPRTNSPPKIHLTSSTTLTPTRSSLSRLLRFGDGSLLRSPGYSPNIHLPTRLLRRVPRDPQLLAVPVRSPTAQQRRFPSLTGVT